MNHPSPFGNPSPFGLSRISLWVMIERTKKAGARWLPVSKTEEPHRFERLPSSHPLAKFQQNSHRPEILEKMLSPAFEEFRTCMAHFVHDSRYMFDQGNRHRTVFFGGRNE